MSFESSFESVNQKVKDHNICSYLAYSLFWGVYTIDNSRQ